MVPSVSCAAAIVIVHAALKFPGLQACAQVGASLFFLKRVPDQGGGSVVPRDSFWELPLVFCKPTTATCQLQAHQLVTQV